MPTVHYPGIKDFTDSCQSLYPDIRWISTGDFQQYQSTRQWLIVDVRSKEEREVSIIPGAIAISDFRKRFAEFVGKPVLVYCTVGCRSAGHTQALFEQGIDAYNLWGGVIDWARHGGEFSTVTGTPTRRVHTHGKRWNLLPPEYIAVW